MSFGQESFYFAVEPLVYGPVPRSLPPALTSRFTHSIFMDSFSFYEMLTVALFELLLHRPTQRHYRVIDTFRKLICSEGFMANASYMKGLILKGLNSMAGEEERNKVRPVADAIMGSERMEAFCECWKDMGINASREASSASSDLNSSIIKVFANFFQVDFEFFTCKGREMQLEYIRCEEGGRDPVGTVSILLTSNAYEDFEDVPAKADSFSEISSIYANWSYHILLHYPDISISHEEGERSMSKQRPPVYERQGTIEIEYPELFAIREEKWDKGLPPVAKELEGIPEVAYARSVLQKGANLINEMVEFLQEH